MKFSLHPQDANRRKLMEKNNKKYYKNGCYVMAVVIRR
jgi:hypothetical protein